MPGRISVPPEVLKSIEQHVFDAVKHAESGYTSAQEEEDTITGELGGALRTRGVQFVEVTNWNIAGTWKWSINYSKFRSKAHHSTESIVGADGILEIRVGSLERDQRKTALFQAKNAQRKDLKLVEQCVKMSVWREAAFVINYTAKGYNTYSIDDILISGGSISKAKSKTGLASWFMNVFLACKVGHPDLYYEKDLRRLYWAPEKSLNSEAHSDSWVWIDFRPKHLIKIDITPPDWKQSRAKQIRPESVSLNRLKFTCEDLFSLKAPFTLAKLRQKRATLLHAYHSDKSNNLPQNLRTILDSRVIEIEEAYKTLQKKVIDSKKTPKKSKSVKKQSESGLEEPKTSIFDEILKSKKKEREKVKVRKRKRK